MISMKAGEEESARGFVPTAERFPLFVAERAIYIVPLLLDNEASDSEK